MWRSSAISQADIAVPKRVNPGSERQGGMAQCNGMRRNVSDITQQLTALLLSSNSAATYLIEVDHQYDMNSKFQNQRT
jgi:hypothetical protein